MTEQGRAQRPESVAGPLPALGARQEPHRAILLPLGPDEAKDAPPSPDRDAEGGQPRVVPVAETHGEEARRRAWQVEPRPAGERWLGHALPGGARRRLTAPGPVVR